MARRQLHSQDSILDAVRSLVARNGPRAVTIKAVAEASNAPTGSIYHRFGSLDELLVRTWLRAVRRSQLALLGVDYGDPVRGAIDAALAMYDFCLAEREDALLLGAFRAEDLRKDGLPDELRMELDQVNAPVERPLAELACRLSSVDGLPDMEVVLLAVVDLPYGFARRYLDSVSAPPPESRVRLEAAVGATLDA